MAIKHSVSDKSQGDILTHTNWNAAHSIAGFVSSDQITLSGSGLVYINISLDLDQATVQAQGKPTLVTRGIFRGYSLPVWNSDNEEMFLDARVPYRWDGASDAEVHIHCWLGSAEDTKNFKLQFAWENYTPGTDAIPTTSNLIEVETATGASAAQYQSYEVVFTIDYDIDTPALISGNDQIGARLRRIAASANDCAGEIVIDYASLIFRRNKLGSSTI